MRLPVLLLLTSLPFAALAAGDPARGARVFRPCTHCHTTVAGEPGTGPSLATVFGRKAATVEGFANYSPALKASGITWDAASLEEWLADPAKHVPGNTMAFPGVRNARVREDLVAYLQAVSEGRAAPQTHHDPPGARPVDLKKAPPEGQVRSITLCKGEYLVETADGKREKVAEADLAFRTDSSELGPHPGKPVAMGARGNQAGGAIIFASPAEIGRAIRRGCP